MKTKSKSNLIKLVSASAIMALTFVATMFLSIPIGIGSGYVNLGDVIILLGGVILGPVWGTIAGAAGAALADIASGFAIYAPATFVIKGLVALSIYLIAHKRKELRNLVIVAIGMIVSEIIMVLGYFLYEIIIYSFDVAVVDIPFNALQGGVCAVVAFALFVIFGRKIKIK